MRTNIVATLGKKHIIMTWVSNPNFGVANPNFGVAKLGSPNLVTIDNVKKVHQKI
jgi:hypothetical protein